MDDNIVDRYQQQLLSMQSELEAMAALASSSTDTVVLDQSRVGRLSRMDALQGQQMALESERRRKQQLVEIQAALRCIEQGDFGYCL